MGKAAFTHLRHATGLSQAEFAKLLDVGVDCVRSIEQEKYDVSGRIARRAFVATGALPWVLEMAGDSLAPEAQAWDRTAYTPAHFEAWRRIVKNDLLAGIEGGPPMTRFLDVLRSVLIAAGAEDKLGRVQALLSLTLFDAVFHEGFCDTARNRAYADGHGQDFDVLACIAGRIEPEKRGTT